MAREDRLMAYAERVYQMKRLNITVPEELHTQLKIAVAEQKTTIVQFVIDAIKEKIARDKGDSK